ncbi:MAG TPA: ATP-binding cassette domain-containing protein [Oligoflexia bacterium]|nr:ATP-binding cassette domain-containing protein [Oligoflexia bacterium]HMP48930.1 ATP-binding cassette domain-containing protein [Oligoflexia bacterium]
MANKSYSSIYALRRIFALVRGDWKDISVVLVYAIGVGLFSLAFPIAVQSLVNTVAFGTLLQPVVILTIIVAGVLAFSGVMQVIQLYTVEILQRRLVTRMALLLSARIPHIDRQKFDQKFGPEYVLRFLEIFQVQKILATLLLDGIAVFFQVVLGLGLVAFYHPIFLAFALILLFSVVVLFSLIGINAVASAVKESDAKYELAAWIQDLASMPTLFKSSPGEILAAQVADKLVDNYLFRRSRHFLHVIWQNIAALTIQTVASSMLLGLGGWLVIKGQLTLGQLVAAEIIFGMVLLNIAKMGKQLERFYDLSAGVAKLDSLLDLPFEDLSGSLFGVREQPAKLTLENISIMSPALNKPSLENASLEIPAGEKVAIWGENGSGKSFLAKIMFRLAEPSQGLVRLDEFNITTIHPKELRDEVSLITDIEIFHGTILDNLTLGRIDAGDAKVRMALDLVDLSKDVFALPNGLTTVLRGTPFPLSRGQALRLMVARGILNNPRLLILDGTLDLIDEKARKHILNSLFSPACPWTTLVFTHEEDILKQFPVAYTISNKQFEEVRR